MQAKYDAKNPAALKRLVSAGAKLLPFEEMLMYHSFLLGDRPRFVDFDLHGMLANYLYSGHYQLPARHNRIQDWYARMQRVKVSQFVA